MMKNFLPDDQLPQGVVNALHLNKEPLQMFSSIADLSAVLKNPFCPIFHSVRPHREAVGVQYLIMLCTWTSSE